MSASCGAVPASQGDSPFGLSRSMYPAFASSSDGQFSVCKIGSWSLYKYIQSWDKCSKMPPCYGPASPLHSETPRSKSCHILLCVCYCLDLWQLSCSCRMLCRLSGSWIYSAIWLIGTDLTYLLLCQQLTLDVEGCTVL